MIDGLLLKISLIIITSMQAQIAILRRLFGLELHIMAGPVLSLQY